MVTSAQSVYHQLRNLLVGIDAALILLYAVAVAVTRMSGGELVAVVDIGGDQSLAEHWNILKWTMTVGMVGMAAYLLGNAMLWGVCVVFGLILLDEQFLLHEIFGNIIVQRLGWTDVTLLRAQDFGELTVAAVLGLIAIGALATGHRRSSVAERVLAKPFLWLLGALVFCAVGLDMVHMAATRGAPDAAVAGLDFLFTVLEDGGEMVIGSLCVAKAAMLSMEMWKQLA